MSKHSPIGASSCERWFNCPGSIGLSKTVHAAETSKYAATGTAAHEIGEYYLRANKPVDELFLGETIEVGDLEIVVDEDMLEAVGVYVDTVLQDLCTAGINHSHLLVEVEVSLSHLHPEAFGTSDAGFVVPFDTLYVYDYKHGQGVPVSVEQNKQMLYYALGMYRALPPVEAECLEFVETIIVQPRLTGSAPVKRHRYQISELLDFEEAVRVAMGRAMDSSEKSLAAGKWCRFCPAQPICPEYVSHVRQATLVDYRAAGALPEKTDYGASALAKLLPVVPHIKSWCGEVEKYAHQLLQSGRSIEGYKLVEREGNRQWSSPDAVIKRFETEFGDKGLYSPPALVSPAQFEKVLGKQRKAEIQDLVMRPKSGTSLVKDDSSKPPVGGSALGDFAHLLVK